MGRRGPSGQQAGLREQERARADGCRATGTRGCRGHPLDEPRFVHGLARAPAAGNEQRVMPWRRNRQRPGMQLQTIAERHPPALHRRHDIDAVARLGGKRSRGVEHLDRTEDVERLGVVNGEDQDAA